MTKSGANIKGRSKSDISYQVLAYLIENPDAQDTFEGILCWWLLRQKLTVETERVKQTLAELVAKGLILEGGNSATGVLYQVNRRKFHEIRAILKQMSESSA